MPLTKIFIAGFTVVVLLLLRQWLQLMPTPVEQPTPIIFEHTRFTA